MKESVKKFISTCIKIIVITWVITIIMGYLFYKMGDPIGSFYSSIFIGPLLGEVVVIFYMLLNIGSNE